MREQGQSVESWIRRHATKDRMSDVEAELAWIEIQARLTNHPGPPAPALAAGRARRRRLVPLAVAGGLTAAVLFAFALLPVGAGPEQAPRILSTTLESASAAEILQVAADSARRGRSTIPGSGEVLYWRAITFPNTPGGGDPSIRQELIDDKGRGQRIEIDGAGNRTVTEFDADQPDPAIEPDDSWRALFSFSQLAELPTEPDALLESLREQVIAEAGERGDLGEGASEGESTSEGEGASADDPFSVDYTTLTSAVQLLTQAPLNADQRAALFELLMDAPQWFRANDDATVSLRNMGPDPTESDRIAIQLRIEANTKPSQDGDNSADPDLSKLELQVMPTAGEIIAHYEYNSGKIPVGTLIRNLFVIPAEDAEDAIAPAYARI